MSEGDVSLACVSALVDELVLHGLEHACLSPGSRSTPLTLALARHPGVRVHVHLDERASGFFALGIAKATHRPVAVACTSGTAAANLLPPVVEANMSRVPLVVMTADRPPELRGVGANQTIDQSELYGRHARRFVDAPVPGERPEEDAWRALAREAVGAALAPPPGPVHVNLPFREPLVPEHPTPTGSEPRPTPSAEVAGGVAENVVDELTRLVSASKRGVVLAGSLRRDAAPVVELARRAGWPLLAEPTTGLRVPGALSAGQLLLSDERFAASHAPDVVLQLGAAPTSRAGLAFAAGAARLAIVDPDDLVADPSRHASLRIVADPAALADAATDRVEEARRSAWLADWQDADGRARRAIDALLDSWDEPFEGRAARDVAASVPDGGTLVVASSMPVRDLDTFMAPRTGLRVLANRGASGVDGFVSTVLGVAATGAPTTALCGDLSLLHDVGSLLWSARRGLEAVFVVPNNDGGAVFSFLPQRGLPEHEELFATPHGLDFGRIAAAAGAGHTLVERAGDLVQEVERARAAGGVWIVEVPSDRARNVARHEEVGAAVAAALGSG